MLKHSNTAVLPLSILLALTALTLWLRYATVLPETRSDGKDRHDPDFIITDATVRKLDRSGNLRYTLVAETIRHYPDDDTTDLTHPKLDYQYTARPPVMISAVRGHSNAKGQQVDLSNQVEVRRAAAGKYQELVLTTSQLTVLTDEEKAFTKEQVLITQGKSWVQGIGMQIDNKLQTYLLEAAVTGEIESRFAGNKP